MVDPEEFLDGLQARGVGFFAGVPDSLLKNLCSAIEAGVERGRHVIAANEGNAVYPLASLADPEVYRNPLLLLIG